MEKPSLEIGNSNWAIKEGELLGYNRAGNDYLPIPITMTRASLGTRVNPESLVEDVALLGVEEVEDGNFPTPNTEWAFIGTTEISGGTANFPDSTNSFLIQENIIDLSVKRYKLTYNVVSTNGNNFRLAGGNSAFVGTFGVVTLDSATVGVKTVYLISNGTKRNLQFNNHNFIGSIDNVSLKEVTIDNLARVDYTDGTSSLLVEPQRTNLITYSSDFTQWDKNSGTNITLDSLISPDGTQNADLIVASGSGSRVGDNVSIVSGNTYTLSVYLKNNGGNTSITIGSYTTTQLATITINDEWNRYTTTFVASSTTTSSIRIISSGSNINLYAWGAQLEEGSYPTSYIPTSGLTVTRVQETYEKTGISNLINSEEGVLFLEMAAFSESNLNSYITIGQNTSNGILGISFYTGSNNILLDHWEGASETYHIESISDVTEFNKIAICYDGTSIKGYINGSPVWNTTVTAWSSNALSELNFAFGNSGTNKFLGKVKQLQIFKTALKDEQLKTLTT